MPEDTRVIEDNGQPVAEVVRPRDPAPVSYSARVGSSCMLWGMIIGLGFFVAMILLWVVSNVGTIGNV